MIRTGLDVLVAQPGRITVGTRVGLLCNQASCNAAFRHAGDLLREVLPPGSLRCLFSPQHGFFSVKQDNMIESTHMTDPFTGLPVYSLYGETRTPTTAMLDEIDLLIVDLQDVGTRVYTYVWTMVLCMEAAAQAGVRVMVLDRPNPLGGELWRVTCLMRAGVPLWGLYPLAMRLADHGRIWHYLHHTTDLGPEVQGGAHDRLAAFVFTDTRLALGISLVPIGLPRVKLGVSPGPGCPLRGDLSKRVGLASV